MSHPGARAPALALTGSLCLLLLLAGPGSALGPFGLGSRPYADGEIVEVTGIVTDAHGDPIPRLALLFEGSRRNFQIKKMRKVKHHTVRVAAYTDDKGEYRLDWKWHRYYNHFELKVVLNVRLAAGQEETRVLASLDLSERIKGGSPLVASITVDDTAFLKSYRAFLAAIDTDDEERVFDAMGRPDKVEGMNFPDRREESWWYFARGKTYRFLDGTLDEVVEFDPVKAFPR